MLATHKVEGIAFDNSYIFLNVNGNKYKVRIDIASPKLAKASKIELEIYKISQSGYGIHWPVIDEDLSIDNLIKLAE